MSTCKTLSRICVRQPIPPRLPITQCRHESTTRRHKKLLAVPQAPSYAATQPTPTLIFNPPSSTPSVYHTPLKFLPKDDKRRLLASQASYQSTRSLRTSIPTVASPGTPLSTSSLLPPKPSAALPPAVRPSYEKKYHLGEKEIAEIQRLRKLDPERWTRTKLAEKFGCSQFFVGMVAKCPERGVSVAKEREAARERWGQRRRMAREDRERRKELWGRDA